MKIQFEIPGPIQPKQRPRFNRRTGAVWTPRETQVFENKVGLLAAYAGLRKIKGNVRMRIVCEITLRKDLDNVCKSVIDGCKQYFNDMYLMRISAHKTPVKEGQERVIVIIENG